MSHDHTHVREFFTPRAATWDSRFPDDGPAYEAAVRALAPDFAALVSHSRRGVIATAAAGLGLVGQ
ncbi:hypothetical protein ADL35_49340 [Streptomyces sp. NRRL WC-3753]|nr:hypothetical protein ADL35_49340 [Streptomyces sp. NRRL WC-3753]